MAKCATSGCNRDATEEVNLWHVCLACADEMELEALEEYDSDPNEWHYDSD